MIPSLSKKYLDSKVSDINLISDMNDAVEFIRPKFTSLNTEEVIMVCMNNAGKILNTVTLGKGSLGTTELDTRKLVQEVIASNATQVIIAHNHPSGICAPSTEDLKVTNLVSSLLSKINAKLINHFIFTDNDYYSFAQSPKHAFLLLAEPEKGENQ